MVTIRQKAPRQRAEGKEQGCKVEGYDKCLAGFDIISCPVEYLHFGGNEAGGRRQEAGGKKEGCKVEGNYN
ncbi:MAG: hypothetical protein F6K47_17995 [Symploca sp. SIO2E6]|nr:hypothetical protein [Symploca sp. SIO2E6]